MKRLFVGALVAALCSLPGTSRAETQSAPGNVAAAPREAQAADGDAERSEGEAGDYADREKAAPQLAEFEGGAEGIYIGAGALAVALVVVLLLVAL
jgi:hypothetical protein